MQRVLLLFVCLFVADGERCEFTSLKNEPATLSFLDWLPRVLCHALQQCRQAANRDSGTWLLLGYTVVKVVFSKGKNVEKKKGS